MEQLFFLALVHRDTFHLFQNPLDQEAEDTYAVDLHFSLTIHLVRRNRQAEVEQRAYGLMRLAKRVRMDRHSH